MVDASDVLVKLGSQSGEYSFNTPGLIEHLFDTANVYILEIGDHQDMCLVSILLTNKNYLGWGQDILNSLTAKGKEGFILGTLPRPALGDLEYK